MSSFYRALIAALEDGNFELARSRQQQSIDMINLPGKYEGISAGKAYVKMIGLNCGEFRLFRPTHDCRDRVQWVHHLLPEASTGVPDPV